ncbi:MAG: hypothetical protein A2X61_15380 [Ignavibacteria bacterium GWB2_35_12]|nr:MAG: hypothetical protein A2X63_03215 [Ignavibacteria bacterium GWA2_35_8]OGU38795.1 MAG: hypothetical protein A2X61_15380 [Ignavibacteria bacterium GWB2_35_12]OGU92293.1 MAG: hypothetical protein A2220_00660 [Ignavibacteria bacterium RIFOXYA2_FULL_35_10]OGV20295.1 MAG: hypothetical protein A2475_12425 [Ignavibacteria bacterium RIFOXYC2_FULL_35_21]
MDKICVSIFANDFDFCIEIVKKYEFVELRLDERKLSNTQISEIIKAGKSIITTCRRGYISDEERFDTLHAAVNLGTEYIDIEHDFEPAYKNKLVDSAKANECRIINSYHNFDVTPEYQELAQIAKSLENDCDIIKIACKVNSRDDLINLLPLYKEFELGKLISLGIGNLGKISRVAALILGAPFTYASSDKGIETSEGQLDYITLKQIYERIK